MVRRDHGHIRRLLKYASYDESHRRGIPCSLALRIKKRRGSLQNVINIYELFRRVLPNDVTLSKSTSFFHGSALTDMCCHLESAD